MPVEERVANLEAARDHARSDVLDLRTHLLRLESKLDALDGRMRDSFESLKVGRAMDKVWALLTVGVILGIVARGFKWI
jgi:hypothetical protein